MTRMALIGIFVILICCISDTGVHASTLRYCGEGLRCSSKIISPGDTKARVRAACGEPSAIDTWEEERIRIRDGQHRRRRNDAEHYQPDSSYVIRKVTIEEWTCNFGPHRFIYYLKFENSRLRCIESGDYGLLEKTPCVGQI
jgi:hypothetical protein